MDIPVINITLNTDTDPTGQYSEWCICQTLPAPARNKQVGLLVAERIRELFPCAVIWLEETILVDICRFV